LSQLVEGSFLGAGQVFAVQDLYCSGLVLFGMLICSPVLAIAGFFGSLVGTFLGEKNFESLQIICVVKGI